MMLLSSLPLRVGQPVQLQSERFAQIRLNSTLMGFAADQAVIVSYPQHTGGLSELVVGDPFILRAIAGRQAVAFRTRVLHVGRVPFAHVFLAYPASVDAVEVRKASRLAVQIDASMSKVGADGETAAAGSITDLSVGGACLRCKSELAAVGDAVEVEIAANEGSGHGALQLKAKVKSVAELKRADLAGQSNYGLEFLAVGSEQAQALQQLIQGQVLGKL